MNDADDHLLRLRALCVELALLDQNQVKSYRDSESDFWLELRREPGGWRHYLDERPVHCGTGLECWIDGRWASFVYEAEGLGDTRREPSGFLAPTREPSLPTLRTNSSDDVIIARWPRRRR